MLRKYIFRVFGGRAADPNAFQWNRGKREERETEGKSERIAERNQDIIKQRKELQAIRFVVIQNGIN